MASPEPLVVEITHEPFIPWVTLRWHDQSEELEHADALRWFMARGARDAKVVNDAICQALNFGKAILTIGRPVKVEPDDPLAPKI